jgi:hypothetical protein
MPAEIAPTLPEKKVYPVIDEGVYQAVIEDVESGKQKPYDFRFDPAAAESEAYYVFKFKVLTPGPAQGRLLWSKRGKACLPVPPEGKQKPSIIWRVASAVKGSQITFEEGSTWTLAQINSLIGKQLVLVVEKTLKQDGSEGNIINTYMHARETLADVKLSDDEKPATPAAVPARYANIPEEFRPKIDPNDGPEINIGDMP